MAAEQPPIVSVWADAATGSPDIVQPSPGFIEAGWPLTAIPPSRGFFNWVLWYCSNGVRWLSRRGINDWHAGETYAIGDLVRSAGKIYGAYVIPTVGVAPQSNLAHWAIWMGSLSATIAAYAEAITTWKNGLQQPRFMIDHLGFPAGRIVGWTEDWRGNDSLPGAGFANNANFTATVQRWYVDQLSTGGGVTVNPSADVPTPRLARCARIALGLEPTDFGSFLMVNTDAPCIFSGFNAVTIEGDVWLGSPAQPLVTEMRAAFGFGDMLNAGATGVLGGVIFKGNGNANWQCRTGNTTAVTTVDSGVPAVAGVWHRLRVEWHGEFVSDNGVAAMRFYIGETLVATITTNLPTGVANPPVIPSFSVRRDTGASFRHAFIGPIQFRSNY
jgi:hypothetical protein